MRWMFFPVIPIRDGIAKVRRSDSNDLDWRCSDREFFPGRKNQASDLRAEVDTKVEST